MPDITLIFDYLCARCGIDPTDERGMTTTEVAVITFLLVGAAIAGIGIVRAVGRGGGGVLPGGKVSFDLTADELGDWAFHCHMLLHMMSGMFRVVTVRHEEDAA